MVRLSRNAQLFVRTVVYRDAKGMVRVVFAMADQRSKRKMKEGEWESRSLAPIPEQRDSARDDMPMNRDETEWSAGAYLESGWSAVRKGARP